MNWNAKKIWPLLVVAAFAVVCFCFFQLLYPYHFFFKGQNQLFLMSWQYVATMFAKPAWAACTAGEFLTQLYYYNAAGAVILTASLTLLLWLSYKALSSLKLKKLDKGFSMILAAGIALREASCHLFYTYTLSSTIALIGGLLSFLALHKLMKLKWPYALAAILSGAVFCYWMSATGCGYSYCYRPSSYGR